MQFIGESYSLSTNILHYQAIRLAQALAKQRGDKHEFEFKQWADTLAIQINDRFWNSEMGQYMSYIGEEKHPVPYAKIDLLGLSLGILTDIFPVERAKRALSGYPMSEAGSPVVWPQESQQRIYHNRAIWPFVSAYSLRAARKLNDSPRIIAEVHSIMRGAALAGSNMENYELMSQDISGPVVNSEYQLWSVAGYISMVMEGVFGLEDDGSIQPKIPSELIPELFGKSHEISLTTSNHSYRLILPPKVENGLLVAGNITTLDRVTTVELVVQPRVDSSVAKIGDADSFAPKMPNPPEPIRNGEHWNIQVKSGLRLWIDGKEAVIAHESFLIPDNGLQHCLSLTRREGNLESLHSKTVCIGPEKTLSGNKQWQFTASKTGNVRLSLQYINLIEPINTGVTAVVKQLVVKCNDGLVQKRAIIMPHSVMVQNSTSATFKVRKGNCTVNLNDGFNMSKLKHFELYTRGRGGRDGMVNEADVKALNITEF
ncbi:hypothetical protein [Providencia stuartii]|uniref:hypothetical protein n=1 Tax=Providencia stuartii TaxID=588 RepID=UPI00300CD727